MVHPRRGEMVLSHGTQGEKVKHVGQRLFDEEELAAIAQSGLERVKAALATGNAAESQRVFDHVLDLYRQFHDIYHGWTASLFAFLNETYGHKTCAAMTHIEDVLAQSARVGMHLDALRSLQEHPEREFAARLAAGDFNGAGAFYQDVERGARDLHDFYRDYVSAILSRVYREYGVDALAACLRASSEKDWMPWMEEEINDDPRQRLIVWAELLGVANFGTITIEEHDDRFVMVQDPCGSCGRQHRGGRYDEPWNLATIEEAHPTTYGSGGCTAYRAHIPMMHYVMPVERMGAPWPLIQCPKEKSGHCQVTLFKNPKQSVPASTVGWSA
jgi:hypothetical protein